MAHTQAKAKVKLSKLLQVNKMYDSAISSLISDDNDTECRRLTQDFVDWSQPNHLLINVGKTKEMMVYFRRHPSAPLPVNIQET